MGGVPRKHHYVPEFYLARFTPSGSKEDRLWVVDQKTGAQFRSAISNLACQRDFYRVNVKGCDPNVLEEAFSVLESEVAGVLAAIDKSARLPKGNDLNILMNFVALMAVRVPSVRRQVSELSSEVAKLILKIGLASKERYEAIRGAMRKDGADLPADLPYEELRDFVYDESNYTIVAPNELFIQALLAGLEVLLPALHHRKWSLIIAQDKAGEFICSDSPVALVWMPPRPLPEFYGPGFGLPNTEVTIPLGRRIVLSGRFEGTSGVWEVDRRGVATLNSRTAMCSERFVYSAGPNFEYLKPDGGIGNVSDLLAAIREAPGSK